MEQVVPNPKSGICSSRLTGLVLASPLCCPLPRLPAVEAELGFVVCSDVRVGGRELEQERLTVEEQCRTAEQRCHVAKSFAVYLFVSLENITS